MSQLVILWRNTIREWYPEYEIRTHFVPSVAITRIPYGVDTVADLKVFVPKRNTDPSGGHVQESDTRDDLALQRVTSCLRDQNRLQNEPMFVVSRLNFSKYLEGGCPANAAKMLRANDLSPEYRRGQFDLMIIHRRYGILIGEIKSVLANKDKLQVSTDEADQIVTVKVRSAMKQVDKAEIVLQGLIKDLKTEVKIHKTVLLPYVSAEVLRRAVIGDKQLLQVVLATNDSYVGLLKPNA